MNKEHLHTLLVRYRSGVCTEKEKYLVEQWFIMLDKENEKLSDFEHIQMEERIWNEIQPRPVQQIDAPSKLQQFKWRWMAAAVVLLATSFLGYTYYQKVNRGWVPAEAVSRQNGLNTRSNNTDSTMSFQLADGTVVQLAPKGTVSYPTVFEEKQRVITLVGKAFFKVVKSPGQPFYVHTGEVVTKVLGTSFWVSGQRDSKTVEVAVVTGRVSVFQKNEPSNEVTKSGVILTANQKVKYSGESREFVTSLVANPVLIRPEAGEPTSDQSFLFEDAPLIRVVGELEKAYGIEIILENEALNGCLITADINNQPLFTKLDLLCSSVNAQYEVRGTKILVTGKGCLSDHLNQPSSMK